MVGSRVAAVMTCVDACIFLNCVPISIATRYRETCCGIIKGSTKKGWRRVFEGPSHGRTFPSTRISKKVRQCLTFFNHPASTYGQMAPTVSPQRVPRLVNRPTRPTPSRCRSATPISRTGSKPIPRPAHLFSVGNSCLWLERFVGATRKTHVSPRHGPNPVALSPPPTNSPHSRPRTRLHSRPSAC